jgi:hypothetical protein
MGPQLCGGLGPIERLGSLRLANDLATELHVSAKTIPPRTCDKKPGNGWLSLP